MGAGWVGEVGGWEAGEGQVVGCYCVGDLRRRERLVGGGMEDGERERG